MAKLNRTDRRSIAEKIIELGNLVAGGLILESLLSGKFILPGIIISLLLLFGIYLFGIIFMKGKE